MASTSRSGSTMDSPRARPWHTPIFILFGVVTTTFPIRAAASVGLVEVFRCRQRRTSKILFLALILRLTAALFSKMGRPPVLVQPGDRVGSVDTIGSVRQPDSRDQAHRSHS